MTDTARNVLFFTFIFLFISLIPAEEIEFSFTSSYDQSLQKAVLFIPDTPGPDHARPLLVIAHYMGGNRYTAKRQGYYEACTKRGWLLVCPDLHGTHAGGEVSMAAPEAQHDVIDAIHYVQQRYHVDTTRVYLAGRSMGGMLSQIMAAKYPDIFAAVVSGQGVSDLKRWTETTLPRLYENALPEIGSYNQNDPFEYERRSSVNFARNVRYVPLILWHGTNDAWVPAEQSQILYDSIKTCHAYQPRVYWLVGAPHAATNYTAEWVCEQLSWYQNVCESGMNLNHRFYPELHLITDESKWYFWLHMELRAENMFAEVSVTLSDSTLTTQSRNVSKLTIDLNRIPEPYRPIRYHMSGTEYPELIITRGDRELRRIPAATGKEGALLRH